MYSFVSTCVCVAIQKLQKENVRENDCQRSKQEFWCCYTELETGRSPWNSASIVRSIRTSNLIREQYYRLAGNSCMSRPRTEAITKNKTGNANAARGVTRPATSREMQLLSLCQTPSGQRRLMKNVITELHPRWTLPPPAKRNLHLTPLLLTNGTLIFQARRIITV